MNHAKNGDRGHKWLVVTELTRGHPLATYGRGRVCDVSGCRTRLSVYNPETRCSLHDHPLY
jgi:hypothetical protein